jgi:general secretion pathway protein D
VRQPDASEAEIWVGTESNTRMRPPGGRAYISAASAAGLAKANVSSEGATSSQPGAVQPGSRQNSDGRVAPSALFEPGSAGLNTPAQSVPFGASWRGPAEVKVGETLILDLDLNSAVSVRSMAIQLAWDTDRLTLQEAKEGDYLKQGDAQTSFTQSLSAPEGQATFGMVRTALSGTPGRGSLLRLKFQAKAAGQAVVKVKSLVPTVLTEGAPSLQVPPSLTVLVK